VNDSVPANADIVIIGGGIVGTSVAYHLAKRGATDVILLERGQLTCGTTWHAAGLVGQLRATVNLTRLAQYTAGLYASLEAETGQATGFKQTGSLAVAQTPERLEELKRGASMARSFGLEVDLLTPGEAKGLWPLLECRDLVGAVYLPKDGQTNPIDTTQALARGARTRGVKIIERCGVRAIRTAGNRVTAVSCDAGEIRARVVVNCAGMWARDIGGWVDACVPVHAAEHFYIVTEPVPNLAPGVAILRDADGCSYFK
jgi:glycine/D-amino acid oxidase-like deaminating enzyme